MRKAIKNNDIDVIKNVIQQQHFDVNADISSVCSY